MSNRGERPVTCRTCFLIKCVAEQATVSPRAWHRFVVRVTLGCDLRACAYSNTWADQPLGWSRPCQHHAASAGCLQRPARPAVARDRDGVQHRVSALGLRTRQSARWSTIPQAAALVMQLMGGRPAAAAARRCSPPAAQAGQPPAARDWRRLLRDADCRRLLALTQLVQIWQQQDETGDGLHGEAGEQLIQHC